MTDTHVMFRAGGHSFAVASAVVGAIHDDLKLQSVAGVQRWFLGVAAVDGQLLPVTDLAGFLGVGQSAGRTLAINSELGLGALRVDEVLGVDEHSRRLDDAQLPTDLQPVGELFTHALESDTGEHWVLDVPRLLQSTRFINIGADA